ncbi:MAG: carboxypeptidase-like regulatory domain-containing protein [Sphingobacteriales bacterium]
MQKILAFVILLLCLQSVTAQTIVKGKVIDNNKVPVAAATVLILAKNDSSLVKGQATNAEGIYELTNITAGNYILMVEMVGHQTIYQNLNVLPNQKINEQGTLTLIAGEVSLNEVVVTGKKRLFETQVDRTVFNVQNSPAAASSTVLPVLAPSPNIDLARVTNQISMNGKQGVIVMLNGKPMRTEQSVLMQYLGGLTAVNIKKIEFIHTPPASVDAAGNAGVINIETIKKEDEGSGESTSVRKNSAGISGK